MTVSASDPKILHWKGTGVIGIETGITCAAILDRQGIKKLANFLNAHRDEFEIQEALPPAIPTPTEQEIRETALKGLAGRMRIYKQELQEKYNKTDNIISFTEVETVKKTFEWIDKQIVELRTPTPEAQR